MKVLVLVAVGLLLAQPTWAYVKPVTAPIIDHFRAPPTPYSAGNRGLEYQVDSGMPVVASQNGVVTFAGQVGGELFVVINHPDGLKTTYGYLGVIEVHLGQEVATGERLGTTSDDFHFGLRRGDNYLDPESLFKGAHLVPVEPSK